uniref:Uncharacterized protein n=1 Tax=Acrobeloides nanus TaxID=290746 RepID=A0A914CP28_9BILA
MGSIPTEISNDEDSDEIIDSLKNCIFVSCGPKFRSIEDLNFLVRNIRFTEWHPFLFDSCIDILNKNKLTSTVMVKGSATAFVYEAKRLGWTLKIFLRRHIYETIAKCTAEFTVSKCC